MTQLIRLTPCWFLANYTYLKFVQVMHLSLANLSHCTEHYNIIRYDMTKYGLSCGSGAK